jgi:hypothetical protein
MNMGMESISEMSCSSNTPPKLNNVQHRIPAITILTIRFVSGKIIIKLNLIQNIKNTLNAP